MQRVKEFISPLVCSRLTEYDKKKAAAKEKYEYFWRRDDVYSQWYKISFFIGDEHFNCAEQYMMYRKAGQWIYKYMN